MKSQTIHSYINNGKQCGWVMERPIAIDDRAICQGVIEYDRQLVMKTLYERSVFYSIENADMFLANHMPEQAKIVMDGNFLRYHLSDGDHSVLFVDFTRTIDENVLTDESCRPLITDSHKEYEAILNNPWLPYANSNEQKEGH